MPVETTWEWLIEMLGAVVSHALLGGGVILFGVAFGFREGGLTERFHVRVLIWWMEHVLRPLLATRSWVLRAAGIALNNSVVCLAMVAAGMLGLVVWAVVAVVGFSLGIALRLLITGMGEYPDDDGGMTPGRRVLVTVGMGLNLLEVPAILLCSGLGLAQGALWQAISTPEAFGLFGWIALPVLAVAAAGEALWMHVCPLPNWNRPDRSQGP